MRRFTHARRALAATAVACASTLVLTSTGAVAAKDPAQPSKQFRKAVTPGGIGLHLDALQEIADANDGTRVSGSAGYKASRDYVVKTLRAAGYKPTVQTFQFPYFAENTPSTLTQLTPDATTYKDPDQFSVMDYSASGDVSGQVVPVDTNLAANPSSTSGCEAEDFASFPAGAIALMQRGTCPFADKVANAEEAGAAAALVFNRGVDTTDDGSVTLEGTLGEAGTKIPALGLSFAAGVDLGSPAGTTVQVVTDTINDVRTTYNVIADTQRGDPDRVVMTGAHLDSVEAGPGINDNGSGTATLLETAEQLAKVKKLKNKVRFAFWGAEEEGLLGSTHYVDDLVENDPDTLAEIGAYLNFDMVGSPNFVRFVYDGDNSLGADIDTPPAGSGDIEALFTDYFAGQGLESEPTAFDGRSDYGPFIENGVPSGGLFSGAEETKSAEEASIYGGVAGAAYDACYHQACDTRANVNMVAIDQFSDAAAHVLYVLAQSNGLTQDRGAAKKSRGVAAQEKTMRKGHQALR
jgi:Zn-dependent M28 family amino/carboxypeptidase